MNALRNSFGARSTLNTANGPVSFYRLGKLEEAGVGAVSRLPFSIKVVLESVLRSENGLSVTSDDIAKFAKFDATNPGTFDVPFMPARVLMQDFTGVPAVVDLAALRSAMSRRGKDASRINPILPVDLVIDHSVQVDVFGSSDAAQRNTEIEFRLNRERYEFLRWGQQALSNFRVVPPASGICHQVNLEYLARVVQTRADGGETLAYIDSVVGTDSHTTMINGLGVLGWGVGGIEAEAVMLGQPFFMLPPEVVGVKITGELPLGATATDLVLVVTELLRKTGVVSKFVEYFGPGLSRLTLPDRATIANMAPEYGARCAFFPVDDETLNFLHYTGRPAELVELVERVCKEQGLFRTDATPDPVYTKVVELDLASVVPSLAGPKRPQDRIALTDMKAKWNADLTAPLDKRGFALAADKLGAAAAVAYPNGASGELRHGDVVIAAITSCTNTSNPSVLIGAGLLAKKAALAGLSSKPHVKTSLAPGSKVVTGYLNKTGLLPWLEKLGFHVVGYGCTTCIGNSGPLPDHVESAIKAGDLVAAAVLSGNRNFEGRVHPRTRANYLASPVLVVAYALAGTVNIDLENEPIGQGANGPVFLRDIWPSAEEIAASLAQANDPALFHAEYDGVESSNPDWNAIPVSAGEVYDWKDSSTYIQEPPFFIDMPDEPAARADVEGARALVSVADSVTTDHISPAGNIPETSPAGRYLIEHGVEKKDFNSYGARRGNDRVMTRGTFANIRIRNKLAPGTEGGVTTHWPTGEVVSIHEAALRYKAAGTPTIVLAGRDYGMGSSRDWAAKGTFLLGVRAVIAQSFETIHRSNLVGMGVLPLVFEDGQNADSLGLTGDEEFTIRLGSQPTPGQQVEVVATRADGTSVTFTARSRLDSVMDVEYYRHGGILQMVLRDFMKSV
ncbi:MAG: aconitate hydratase AcnA [Deltaproteobacteria bacterium]|nr:aconitate hydratase AcnA [Deltaproteobacteria bacterium]